VERASGGVDSDGQRKFVNDKNSFIAQTQAWLSYLVAPRFARIVVSHVVAPVSDGVVRSPTTLTRLGLRHFSS